MTNATIFGDTFRMYDKAVRRRRAVLAVLVALSLILLTAYFGESSTGSLHGVQRGAMEVLAPIQEGANRVVKPFRDLFGWFGDTLERQGRARQAREGARRAAHSRSRPCRSTAPRTSSCAGCWTSTPAAA